MEMATNNSTLGPRRKTTGRGEDCPGPGNQVIRGLIRRITEEPFPGLPLTPSEATWACQHSVALTCLLASSLRQTLGYSNPSSHTLFSQAATVLLLEEKIPEYENNCETREDSASPSAQSLTRLQSHPQPAIRKISGEIVKSDKVRNLNIWK